MGSVVKPHEWLLLKRPREFVKEFFRTYLVKHGLLTACIASHRYLLEPAISRPACIHQTLRFKDSSLTCISDGVTDIPIVHSFHLRASWRTSYSPTCRGDVVGPSRSQAQRAAVWICPSSSVRNRLSSALTRSSLNLPLDRSTTPA
jgi:hypothetical protein